ncbi:MAG: TIGR00730 family Rossman fold protein [Fuerstiella sp.]
MASICVFCGSRGGARSSYGKAAAELGRVLAERNDTLIYGGGSTGMMGVLADEMLARHGHVIGVIPQALANVELMHAAVTDMRIVPDMHVRKATMHELADAYVALPGGHGTMEELFEALCWAQLAFHTAPIAVLNVGGYYDGLIQLIDTMIREQFLCESYRPLLTELNSVDALKHWLDQHFATAPRP